LRVTATQTEKVYTLSTLVGIFLFIRHPSDSSRKEYYSTCWIQ